MTYEAMFKGEVSVKSTSAGFVVSFQGETDAHYLGHALAAIMSTYMNLLQKDHPECDLGEVRETILEGIECGADNNDEPLGFH